jgi:hypothetical protein
MTLEGQVGQIPNSKTENGLTFDSTRKENSVSCYGEQGKKNDDSESLIRSGTKTKKK